MGRASKRKKREPMSDEKKKLLKEGSKGGWHTQKENEERGRLLKEEIEAARRESELENKRDDSDESSDDSEWETDDEEDTFFDCEDGQGTNEMQQPYCYWIISLLLLQNYMRDKVVCKVN